jgi:transcription elongation factor/antiterminator RfaH
MTVESVCVLNITKTSSKLVPRPPLLRLDLGERWYVVHTLPSCEIRAQLQLGNQGFRTFLPKRQKTVRHARKLTTVIAAFFPGYLFVILDLTRDRWRSINGTFGVASLVMQGDQPHPVPHGILETLITSVDSTGLLRVDQDLQVGASVRLGTGPFAERLAILEHLDDSGRVRVLLELLGQKVHVSMDRNNLLPVGRRSHSPPLAPSARGSRIR